MSSSIMIIHLKKWFPLLKWNLCQDCNWAKDTTVICYIMSVNLFQNFPLLEPLITCFVARTDPTFKFLVYRVTCERFWTFNMKWSLSQIPIICFYSFTFIKFTHQSNAENHEIIVFSRFKGPIDPANISCQNIQCNFIPETTTLEFMAIKSLASPVYSKISPINRK